MKKRHLTRNEIIAQCKAVARETRMCDRTPWTAMPVMCAYTMYKGEGFKAQRLSKLLQRIADMDEEYMDGKIDIKALSDALMDKAGWTIDSAEYTEADITAKKGSFEHWILAKQIGPQNAINSHATRYMLFFFNALIELFGYGKDRLTRVKEEMKEYLDDYRFDKTTVSGWRKELYDEVGIVFEDPIDPLTQKAGSMMC